LEESAFAAGFLKRFVVLIGCLLAQITPLGY